MHLEEGEEGGGGEEEGVPIKMGRREGVKQ